MSESQVNEAVQVGSTERAPDAPPSVTVPSLLVKHERTIRRYVSRRSGPFVLRRASVEDIYQEAVALAVSSADTFRFEDDRRFLAWVFTIVRRVIGGLFSMHEGRLGAFRIKGPCSTGAGVREDELEARWRTPSSLVAQTERTDALRHAIDGLPPLQREVVRLYKIDQLSLSEVARRINRTEGHTCRIVAQALKRLRLRLSPR